MLWIKVDGQPVEKITLVRNEKVVGVLTTLALTKTAIKSKHYLFKYDGWVLDSQVLMVAEAFGCEYVRVVDIENKKIYEVNLSKFIENGIEIDYGHGKQKVLESKYWKIREVA
jgi:hypothetical protein